MRQEISLALDIQQEHDVHGDAAYESVFQVSNLASSSIGAVGAALSELLVASGTVKSPLEPQVDQRLASLWFGYSMQARGWEMPPIWDAIAGDYQAADGWIKLHTNLSHHRAAACRVLDTEANRDHVAKAVSKWNKDDLELAIVNAGGVCAAMRSRDDWLGHSQGQAIAGEPLIAWRDDGELSPSRWRPNRHRPLSGLKVLDLTRVLAGPVATRTLAGFGAEVLRIDPPYWQEPNVVPDVTIGKRCAILDLEDAEDLSKLGKLISEADVLVHGYRPGALAGLGITRQWRREHAPSLIEVCLDAYGWTGPWAGRRGFDSLVQMSCGIADAGARHYGKDRPTPLPVQALDHATGYLMAAAAIRALSDRLVIGNIRSAKLSLARTAALLNAYPQSQPVAAISPPNDSDFQPELELMPWGKAARLRPPLMVGDITMRWNSPAAELGSSPAQWA